jgi:hypothetical protein
MAQAIIAHDGARQADAEVAKIEAREQRAQAAAVKGQSLNDYI